ncbi:protein kintoun [Archocentrus centrarchus]|uniref:protein kintoun n=1 Tax=Archocentrus centrarchus TaxID=63155 RepID=UPI0011E9DC60|nr:protein kintoun [Archocentrus centrarchus]
MELGEKLKELNVTADEVKRFSEAFKDEKFRVMLRDYAREISDPENRRKYEEEIQILEQERGNTVEFIHPKPFRAIKTSVDGKHKCFINICSSDKIGKPASEWVVSEDGRRGQCWSLPHSLHPGRQDTDPKGNKMMIYDVVFHPDTLHMASKNKSFLEMVDSTAIQGIQDAFKVTLDKKNVREMKTKYKGTPQPCIIRKPIPGFKAKGPSDPPDPFAFPYPDEKRPSTLPQSIPTETPKTTKNSSDAKAQSLEKTRGPTKPHYTVKYRSCIDLQDFRCSRDSAQSPRPKEIVVTVDLPLLKSARDTSLEVKEKKLLLESKKPAYRLELPLAYPVDEDKGEAKFIKQKGQLIVTLPVLPHKFDLFAGPAKEESESDGESQEDKSGVKEEDKWKKREGKKREQEACAEGKEGRQTEDLEQEKGAEKSEKEEARTQEKGEQQIKEEAIGGEVKLKMGEKGQESVEEERGTEGHKGTEAQEEDKLKEQKQLTKQANQNEDSEKGNHQKWSEGGCDRAADDDSQCDTVKKRGISAEKENSVVDEDLAADKQQVLISAEQCHGVTKKKVVNLASSLEVTPKTKPSDNQEESEETKSNAAGKLQVELDVAFQNQTSSDKTQKAATTAAAEDCCFPERAVTSSEMPATGDVKTASTCSEELTAKQEREEMDEDDLPKEQISPSLEDNRKPPPVILREIDEDGNEIVITDHSTSAGFTFQNTLMYELD